MIEHPLLGMNHVTAMASDPQQIFDLMSKVLGLHLIKKTVNQDALDTYHLYFTDDMGTAGTDMTFFTFPNQAKGKKGTNMISRASFRVPNDAAIDYWLDRLNQHNVANEGITTQFGDKIINFHDQDDQQFQLISDEHNIGVAGGTPWQHNDVPDEFAITGLGPVTVTVFNVAHMDFVLTEIMGYTKQADEGNFGLYEVGHGEPNLGGHGAQVIVEHREDLPVAEEGYGNIHHAAFNTEDRETLGTWIDRIRDYRLPQSGYIDRFYFKSDYFRAAPQILFELATAGPGFLQDETYDEAGIHLELPPFLESQRAKIEAGLKPVETDWRGR
ncbi:ring-cleaving dioxygenase [Lacticaseibacillus brantae]|uniref:Glyoxalase bleomycin resistance protein dioxygenase n=1 Tax=Lacticaseibacillus brantae DSM 23927 TaxID=1423727 RepID=A0A0R2B0K3_9LACO|nr:ring-cleaving dioxygenase [Lacticaseibacillus brantae]KRM72871.1 glyoxalase bleomycin resistance protein dioxygenase [Lacticaseibacillus brantae DSM 23927]